MSELVTISNDQIELSKSAMKVLKNLQEAQVTIQELKNGEEEIKEALKDAMEKTGTKKFENDYVSVSLVPSTTRTTVDAKKLKVEHPRIYKKVTKTTTSKSYVKITYKED